MHQNANNDNKNVHVIVDYPIHETRHHIYSEHRHLSHTEMSIVSPMHCSHLIHAFSSIVLLTSDICHVYILNSYSSMKNVYSSTWLR